MTNAQAQAYAVVALHNIGITDPSVLQRLDHEMYSLFDLFDEGEIERKAQRLLQGQHATGRRIL